MMNSFKTMNSEVKIYLGDDVKEAFSFYSHKTCVEKKEYGGILLGRVTDDMEVFIEIATKPSVFDKSNYLSFIRKKAPSQYIIDRLWEKSQGMINYLGEWHTHPFVSNKPSGGDLKMINEALVHNKLSFSFFIMIIIDTDGHFSITIANEEETITMEDCDNERLFYKF